MLFLTKAPKGRKEREWCVSSAEIPKDSIQAGGNWSRTEDLNVNMWDKSQQKLTVKNNVNNNIDLSI